MRYLKGKIAAHGRQTFFIQFAHIPYGATPDQKPRLPGKPVQNMPPSPHRQGRRGYDTLQPTTELSFVIPTIALAVGLFLTVAALGVVTCGLGFFAAPFIAPCFARWGVREVAKTRTVTREQAAWHGVLLASLAWIPFTCLAFHFDGVIVLWCLGIGFCTVLGAAWGAVCLVPKNVVSRVYLSADVPAPVVHLPACKPYALPKEVSQAIGTQPSYFAIASALRFEARNARITRQYGAGLGIVVVLSIGVFWAAMRPEGNWAIMFALTLPAIGAAMASGFAAQANENDCFDGIEAALFPVLCAHAMKFLITTPTQMEFLQALPISLVSGLVGAAAGWAVMHASIPAAPQERS